MSSTVDDLRTDVVRFERIRTACRIRYEHMTSRKNAEALADAEAALGIAEERLDFEIGAEAEDKANGLS